LLILDVHDGLLRFGRPGHQLTSKGKKISFSGEVLRAARTLTADTPAGTRSGGSGSPARARRPANTVPRAWTWAGRRAFDQIPLDAGIHVVLTGIQMPRMNSLIERWVQTCRHELSTAR
jgi:hypothetical protein